MRRRWQVLLLLAALCSGCATSYPMKISYARAATDISVTSLLNAGLLKSGDVVLVVRRLRDALDQLEKVEEYTAEVYAITAPYLGGKVLARLLLKTLPGYAFQLQTYNYGLGQALNQAELAALEFQVAVNRGK